MFYFSNIISNFVLNENIILFLFLSESFGRLQIEYEILWKHKNVNEFVEGIADKYKRTLYVRTEASDIWLCLLLFTDSGYMTSVL